MILDTLSSALLHVPGAFFFYPWKPIVQAIAGDSYDVAYQFFRRDHSKSANLALHAVALAYTLLGNFGLLFLADTYLFPERITLTSSFWAHSPLKNLTLPALPLSYVTAVTWIIVLMCSPAPVECSSLSMALIAAAYLAAPHVTAHTLELGAAAALAAVLLAAPRLFKLDVRVRGHRSVSLGVVALALRLAARAWRGALAAHAAPVGALLLSLIFVAGSLPKPTVACVLVAVTVGRVAAELTAQDALLYYCGAFGAQLCQGIAHDACGQKATLLQHQDDAQHARRQTLGFEWSHTVFFPNLLLNSMYHSLTGQKDSVLHEPEEPQEEAAPAAANKKED